MIPEGFDRLMGWVVMLLLLVAGGIVYDYLRCWWDWRKHKDEMSEEVPKR